MRPSRQRRHELDETLEERSFIYWVVCTRRTYPNVVIYSTHVCWSVLDPSRDDARSLARGTVGVRLRYTLILVSMKQPT